MPRHNNSRRGRAADQPAPRPLGAGLGWARTESGPDGDWLVRQVPGAQTTKTYRCPGCDHEIRPGTAHIVAWPGADDGSVADRRHWHTGCWSARTHRRPTPRHW